MKKVSRLMNAKSKKKGITRGGEASQTTEDLVVTKLKMKKGRNARLNVKKTKNTKLGKTKVAPQGLKSAIGNTNESAVEQSKQIKSSSEQAKKKTKKKKMFSLPPRNDTVKKKMLIKRSKAKAIQNSAFVDLSEESNSVSAHHSVSSEILQKERLSNSSQHNTDTVENNLSLKEETRNDLGEELCENIQETQQPITITEKVSSMNSVHDEGFKDDISLHKSESKKSGKGFLSKLSYSNSFNKKERKQTIKMKRTTSLNEALKEEAFEGEKKDIIENEQLIEQATSAERGPESGWEEKISRKSSVKSIESKNDHLSNFNFPHNSEQSVSVKKVTSFTAPPSDNSFKYNSSAVRKTMSLKDGVSYNGEKYPFSKRQNEQWNAVGVVDEEKSEDDQRNLNQKQSMSGECLTDTNEENMSYMNMELAENGGGSGENEQMVHEEKGPNPSPSTDETNFSKGLLSNFGMFNSKIPKNKLPSIMRKTTSMTLPDQRNKFAEKSYAVTNSLSLTSMKTRRVRKETIFRKDSVESKSSQQESLTYSYSNNSSAVRRNRSLKENIIDIEKEQTVHKEEIDVESIAIGPCTSVTEKSFPGEILNIPTEESYKDRSVYSAQQRNFEILNIPTEESAKDKSVDSAGQNSCKISNIPTEESYKDKSVYSDRQKSFDSFNYVPGNFTPEDRHVADSVGDEYYEENTTNFREKNESNNIYVSDFPFSLHYLAVQLFKILRTDSASDEACMNIVKNFCFDSTNKRIQTTDIRDSDNALQINERSELPNLPNDLDEALRDAIVISNNTFQDNESSGPQNYCVEIESRLRKAVMANAEYLRGLSGENGMGDCMSGDFMSGDFMSSTMADAKNLFQKLTNCASTTTKGLFS